MLEMLNWFIIEELKLISWFCLASMIFAVIGVSLVLLVVLIDSKLRETKFYKNLKHWLFD